MVGESWGVPITGEEESGNCETEREITTGCLEEDLHSQEEFCAQLRLNGAVVPYPSDGCWCAILLPDPGDEAILSLGKSVLDGLINCPITGQDGSKFVAVELQL